MRRSKSAVRSDQVSSVKSRAARGYGPGTSKDSRDDLQMSSTDEILRRRLDRIGNSASSMKSVKWPAIRTNGTVQHLHGRDELCERVDSMRDELLSTKRERAALTRQNTILRTRLRKLGCALPDFVDLPPARLPKVKDIPSQNLYNLQNEIQDLRKTITAKETQIEELQSRRATPPNGRLPKLCSKCEQLEGDLTANRVKLKSLELEAEKLRTLLANDVKSIDGGGGGDGGDALENGNSRSDFNFGNYSEFTKPSLLAVIKRLEMTNLRRPIREEIGKVERLVADSVSKAEADRLETDRKFRRQIEELEEEITRLRSENEELRSQKSSEILVPPLELGEIDRAEDDEDGEIGEASSGIMSAERRESLIKSKQAHTSMDMITPKMSARARVSDNEDGDSMLGSPTPRAVDIIKAGSASSSLAPPPPSTSTPHQGDTEESDREMKSWVISQLNQLQIRARFQEIVQEQENHQHDESPPKQN